MGEVGKLTSKEKAKDKRLRETYNMTLEEHNAKRAEQKDACFICRRPFSQFQAYQDHDHACCPRRLKKFCGKCNRGLLCFLCNKRAVAWLEFLDKVGIDVNLVAAYIPHWRNIIKLKGGYAPKESKKKSRVARKQKSVRSGDEPSKAKRRSPSRSRRSELQSKQGWKTRS